MQTEPTMEVFKTRAERRREARGDKFDPALYRPYFQDRDGRRRAIKQMMTKKNLKKKPQTP